MAELPDVTSLAPRIAQPRPVRVSNRAGEIVAQGLAETAGAIDNIVQRTAARQDAFNLERARTTLRSADADIQAKLSTDQDWRTHGTSYADAMKKARETAGQMIGGSQARALFEQEAMALEQRGKIAVDANSRRVEGDWGRGELRSLLDMNRRAALETPDAGKRGEIVTGVFDAIEGARASGYIDAEMAQQTRLAWSADYGRGFVEVQNEAEQLRLLRNPEGTPAQFIDPERRANMRQVLEDRLRVKADRREAAAERALATYERQISAGIPATPEAMRALRSTVAGTAVAGELDGLLAAEKEVQETLRKPIGEQMRLLQSRREALMTGGGTLVDGANLARLENAVKQNIALIQNAPLLYGEQRLGDTNTPIEVAGVVDSSQRAPIAATLQERATRIRALQKQMGMRVPMNVLLDQEAAEFKQILDQASPQQATQLFAGLRESAGSMDVFRGAVQQVAPDAPVKAMAGILGAQQSELKTAGGWFTPDKWVTSQNVAATMLEGERLLNPSKSDKADDGKPKTNRLLLPSEAQTSLQERFAENVGTAFANRPDAANVAYQAVQAYYVGKASQMGKLAADSKTVDKALVGEAVRATLGNVIDFNDQGAVLAPWGMTEDDFEDRADRAIAARAKALNFSDTADLGLANANADGQYVLTLKNNWLLDADGNPVTIDLRTVGPDDRRGFIVRPQ